MAGTNDFKAFATDANANVTSQEEWETLTALKKGFSSGKASSAQVSKALRQPSTMAAVLGQFIANAELDALDDGDVDGLVAKLATAITTNLGLTTALAAKQPLDATLTALAGLANGANKLPYFTGADTMAVADLSAFVRDMLGEADATAVLSYLGFGKLTFNMTADFIRIPDIPGGLLIQFATVPVPDGAVAQQIPFTWKTAMSKVFLVGGFIGGDVTTRRCNAQISNSAGGVISATNSGSSLGTSAYVLGIGQV